jgi:prepilin-type N-terminal cleavage/methylation domain-containing protein
MSLSAEKYKGFTIVELLIVVVVIAILAAITIVSYNGIQSRAKESAALNNANQAAKKITTESTVNGNGYPASKQDFLKATGLSENESVTYQYTISNDLANFCLTTTSYGISYKASSDNLNAVKGTCPGHTGAVAGPIITNLVVNPSVELNETGWGHPNNSITNVSNSAALVGTNGLIVTAPNNSKDSGVSVPVSGSLIAGKTYTASFMIKAITAGKYAISLQGMAGNGGATKELRTLTAGQTDRFSFTWTPNTSGTVSFYALREANQAGEHIFFIDGAMLTEGSTRYDYADGSSLNWTWDGTPHSSTSSGPAY